MPDFSLRYFMDSDYVPIFLKATGHKRLLRR